MAPAPGKMKLHEYHQRRLEATVSLVESGLDRMEGILSDNPQNRTARAVEDTLSPEERSRLLDKIRELRIEIQRFAEKFSLRRYPVDVRQVLNAELSSTWVMLENCQPKRMKGYGVEFDPTVRAALEESVGHLVSQVIALRGKIR